MKKMLSIILTIILVAAFLVVMAVSCSAPSEKAVPAPETCNVPMVTVPGNITFYILFSDTATLSQSCQLADAEVSWPLWRKVYIWATGDTNMDGAIGAGETAKNYTFGHPGQNGDGDTLETEAPVTRVSWRDAIVWCNALTEYYNLINGTTLDCVYYTDAAYTQPLRVSTASTTVTWEEGVGPNDGTQDDPYIKTTALGFRLPTNTEWVLAFRFIEDEDNSNDILDAGEYYPNDAVSGSDVPWNDNDMLPIGITFGKYMTDLYAVYGKYWAPGSGWADTDVEEPASIRSKAPNALGIYDMSGNVSEYVFEWYADNPGVKRMARGGGWTSQMDGLIVSTMVIPDPYAITASRGLRVARNAQ
ncbi:MAG: hypothetical protein EHM28_08175 [Spirochaetaceae bacterium]|nr:MAG: hypothetical protein EHM28_08175 [Spirochaetaceae bacterium]